MACSLYHEGKCSPVLSRIRVVKYEALGKNYPSICSQCSKPQCLAACTEGAIKLDEKKGAVTIDEALCVGCRSCIAACPQVGFDASKGIAFKCDLCGGEPQCARFCPSEAVTFSDVNESIMARRRVLADKAMGTV